MVVDVGRMACRFVCVFAIAVLCGEGCGRCCSDRNETSIMGKEASGPGGLMGRQAGVSWARSGSAGLGIGQRGLVRWLPGVGELRGAL